MSHILLYFITCIVSVRLPQKIFCIEHQALLLQRLLLYNFFMASLPLEEKRMRVLLGLYHLHSTQGVHVDVEELEKLADVGSDYYDILRYFGTNGKGWLKTANLVVRMTSEGIDKAEELLKMQMLEKQRRVLEQIYNLGGPTHTDFVLIDRLREELGMTFRELNEILLEFERKRGWVDGPDEAVYLTPAGVREVENPGGDREVGVKYETHFHAPFQGGYIQGPGGTQHILIKNEFDDAIYKLLKGVEDSINLTAVQKMTLAGDIKTVQQLGQLEKTPDVIEAANSRIDSVNSVISSTADLVSLGMVVIPIVRAWFGG